MNRLLKHNIDWWVRLFSILVCLILLQSSILVISASPINLGQGHHIGVLKAYTYDETERSVGAKTDRIGRLSRVLSVKEVRQDHEVLADVARVAAKGGGLRF